jgi:NAD+ diphosphatase
VARAERTLPDVPLSRPALDRRADLRADPGLLPRLLADPATRVVRLVGDLAEVAEVDGRPRLALSAPVAEDHDALAVYLGERDGVHHVAAMRDASDEGSAGEGPVLALDPAWRTLRQVGAHLDDLDAAVFATALALGNWHRTHRHCPRCGTATEPSLGGWIRRCPADGSEHYPRTDVAVIVAVVDARDRLLLARGRGFRSGGMSVLAGFLEPGETLAAAVVREVGEEVGVVVEDVTYLADQPWPFPSSLMVGFRARALGTDLRLQEDEIASARWFTREELTRSVASGEVVLPGRVSIARRLVEHWYGGAIDAPDNAGLR